MKNITYVDLIKAEIKYTRLALNGTDETDRNIAAYHCQQAVEKTCGYAAQRLGIRSIREHNIEKWIDFLREYGVETPQKIVENAKEITNWESKSRYNINFYASEKTISMIINEVENWLKEVEILSVYKLIKPNPK